MQHIKLKPINRITSLLAAVLVFVSCMIIPVVAADSNGNEFINMDKYVEYSFPEADPDTVYLDYFFPPEWNVTEVTGPNWGTGYGTHKGSVITATLTFDDRFCLRMRPLGGKMQGGEVVGNQMTNAHFLDLTVFPLDSWFQPSYTVRIKTGSVDLSAMTGNIYLFFVDQAGKIVKKISYNNPPTVSVDGDYSIYSYARTFKFKDMNLPSNAVGLIPLYTLKNVECSADEITVSYNPLWVGYNLSSLEYEVQENQKLKNTLASVQAAQEELLNGTPEQNQQAQDAVGGLNSSTGKLDALGDQMSSVDKPTIDSNQISAGSLVPQTSLVVLSSPFQALWENKMLLAILTIVVTLVLVSWVFFGKKG